MSEYGNFIRRADLIKNLIERQQITNAAKKPNRLLVEANQRRWLQYQELLRAELTAKIAAANSSGGPTATPTPTFDADAQAFITAAAITDPTQQTAINTLVVSMKGYGIWTKMKALYPFVGGTAAQHKFNLKNPLDTDAAFRLVFNGGWVHSSTGALPNGTNAYADTFLIPSSKLSLNSTHLSVYSRTDSVSGIDIGIGGNTTTNLYLLSRFGGGFYHANNGNEANTGLTSPTTSLGLFINNRILSTEMSIWQNGFEKTDSVSYAKDSVALSTSKIYIGAYNFQGYTASLFSNHQQALTSIGDGLTDTEAANYYTAVQNFQTTLSRNV